MPDKGAGMDWFVGLAWQGLLSHIFCHMLRIVTCCDTSYNANMMKNSVHDKNIVVFCHECQMRGFHKPSPSPVERDAVIYRHGSTEKQSLTE